MDSLWGTTWGDIVMTLLISMTPVLELRAAIPAAVIAGLNLHIALFIITLFCVECIKE